MINREDSAFMEGLLGSLNDIESGTSTGNYVSVKANSDETKKLLEGLSDIGFEYGNLLNPEKEQPLYNKMDNYMEDDNYDYSSHYAKPVAEMYNKPVPKENWSLVEGLAVGTKNIKTYSIKCNHSQQIIMNNMMMYEAALTLVNLLNEGKMISDAKVLGIISSGLQYTKVMNEYIDASKKRQKVLNESKYDKAKELDDLIAEKKSEAIKLKERVKTFLIQEGYITK